MLAVVCEVARGRTGSRKIPTSINVANEDSVTGVTELGVQPALSFKWYGLWHNLLWSMDIKLYALLDTRAMDPTSLSIGIHLCIHMLVEAERETHDFRRTLNA